MIFFFRITFSVRNISSAEMANDPRQKPEISLPQPTKSELHIKFNTIVEDFKLYINQNSRSRSDTKCVLKRLKTSCTVPKCRLLMEDECNSINTSDEIFDKLIEKDLLNLSRCDVFRSLIDAVNPFFNTNDMDEFTRRVNVADVEQNNLGKLSTK